MAGYVAGHDRTNILAIADAFLPPLGLGHHLPSARYLPINKPLNPTFLPFQESLWERAPQSVSFPVPVCFSLVFKPRLVLVHLSTDSLPLKRGIQSFTLQAIFLPGIPIFLCHISFPACTTYSSTLPPGIPKSTYNVTRGIAHHSTQDLRLVVSTLGASVSLPVPTGARPWTPILRVAFWHPHSSQLWLLLFSPREGR